MMTFRNRRLRSCFNGLMMISALSVVGACKQRSFSTAEGFTDQRYAPTPLKLESAYSNLNDLSSSVIEGGATSARLEVAYSLLEQSPGQVQSDVDSFVSALNADFKSKGLESAGSRDRNPEGFENKTITNIHLLEYYAKADVSDQVAIDGDIPSLSQNANGFAEPRCNVSRALRDELLTQSEWRKVRDRFGQTTPLIPHRLKVRSRYYLYTPQRGPVAKGAETPAITQFPRHFRMAARNAAGVAEPLIAKNQLIKFFEVKQSTAQMPVGGSCAFLIRKHRLALLGSEPWLKNGYRFDDVTVLTDAQTVAALSTLYKLSSDSEAYQSSPDTEKFGKFLNSNLSVVTVENQVKSRFDVPAMLAELVRGQLAADGVRLDYEAIKKRYAVLARNRSSKGTISSFDLFVDTSKAQKFIAELPVGGRDDSGAWNWDAKGFAPWLSNWRLRTLLVNLFYAKDVKYIGATDKLSADAASGTDISVPAGAPREPTPAEIDAWFQKFSGLASGIDTWAMAMLKSQERYFRYTGERGMPVLKTRAYDRRSWEIRARAVSDKALRADASSAPQSEAIQMTLDRNLEITVPQALNRKLSTFMNYPLRLNVIEFKFPLHHLENTLPKAAEGSAVLEEVRKLRDSYAGMDSRNAEGNQGKGKRPEGVLLWDYPNNPLAQMSEYLNSAEGVACRVGAGVVQKAAKDCFVTGLALRKFLSNTNVRLFDGYMRKKGPMTVGYEGDNDGLQVVDGVPAGELPLVVAPQDVPANDTADFENFEGEE